VCCISRLQAKLQLTRAQREGIAAGYEHHIQSEAFLHEDCLGIAAKLQVPVGACIDPEGCQTPCSISVS
jgi:hypothetical protein